jgi:DNA topoisomerase-2
MSGKKKFKYDSDESSGFSDEEVVKEVTVKGKKKIEDEYIKMDPREHVLLRPDMYVGAITRVPQEMWIWNEEEKKMQSKKIQFGMLILFIRFHIHNSLVPGLYKIFDEVLVNAADNYQKDKTQTKIEVTIDKESNEITVRNDGRGILLSNEVLQDHICIQGLNSSGIPVTIHAGEKKYVPEMIFGELLTGSSFDDTETKVTGGRNGLGNL